MRISTAITFLLIYCSFVFFTSCEKEENFDNTDIIGDYDFVGSEADSNDTVTSSQGGQTEKTIKTIHQSTEQNGGTVQITASDITSTGITYHLDYMTNIKTYVNGSLIDEEDIPMIFDPSPYNAYSVYKRLTSDSLWVAMFFGEPMGGPAGLTGVKISWSGDTLIMKLRNSFTYTENVGGVPTTTNSTASVTTKLKKK